MNVHYSPDEVQRAKKMDLLTYLRQYEPQELVHLSGDNYCTRTHDSLKISNGKWYWFSRGIGGRSALDYLIKVKGMSFPDAVGLLLECIEGATPGVVSQAGHGTRLTPEALASLGPGLSLTSFSQPEMERERWLVLPEAQEG